MKFGLAVFIGIFSAGWLAPLYFAVDCYMHLFGDLSDSQILGLVGMNSFPYKAAMMNALSVSLIWLAVVIFGWSAAGTLNLLKTK